MAKPENTALAAKSSNTPYLIAVVLMVMLGVIAILIILVLKPDKDNTSLIGQVLTLIAPTTAAILAFMKSNETHLAANSRFEELAKMIDKSARAEGVIQGEKNIAVVPPVPPAPTAVPAVPVPIADPSAPVGVPASVVTITDAKIEGKVSK